MLRSVLKHLTIVMFGSYYNDMLILMNHGLYRNFVNIFIPDNSAIFLYYANASKNPACDLECDAIKFYSYAVT